LVVQNRAYSDVLNAEIFNLRETANLARAIAEWLNIEAVTTNDFITDHPMVNAKVSQR
jgi:hypothetical protein